MNKNVIEVIALGLIIATIGTAGAIGMRVATCRPTWPDGSFPLHPHALHGELGEPTFGASKAWLATGLSIFGPADNADSRVLVTFGDAPILHARVELNSSFCRVRSAIVTVSRETPPEQLSTTIAHALGDVLDVPHEPEPWSIMHDPPPERGMLSHATLKWLGAE
jgi:hypothetical protein